MSVQQSIPKANFANLSFEHFCYEFRMFLRYHFSDLSEIKAFVSAFEHSLPNIIIPRDTFESFISSFSKQFHIQVTLPAFSPLVNFFNFSILI